jgi:AcrR family transcriptional regulator
MRTSRLQRRRLARRLEILRAAGREFRTRGFAETGMREIAAAADLSPANLYNYFRGKDELLFFCQDNALDRLIANLENTRNARSHSATEKLRAVITFHLHCVLDEVEGSAAHLLTNSIPPNLQRRLLAKRDRYEHGVRQLIAAGIRSNEFLPTDPALTTRAILGALNSTIPWFNPQGPLTTEQLAENLATYLIRGLANGRAAHRNGRSLDRFPRGSGRSSDRSVAQPLLAAPRKNPSQRIRQSTDDRQLPHSRAKKGTPSW